MKPRQKRSETSYDELKSLYDELLAANQMLVERNKHMELALEESEAQLRSITDAIPPMIAVVDGDLRYRFVNSAYARQWNRPVESIVGAQVRDIVGPENFAEIEPHLLIGLSGKRVSYEMTLQMDGTREEFVKEVVYVPQWNEVGTVSGVHVVVDDITQERHLNRQLAEREAHLRRVIDNTLNLVGVLDKDGILRDANAPALLAGGLTREDVIGKPFWDCYWWSYDDQIVQQLKASVATALTGEIVRYDVQVRMAGDSLVMIDFMLAPVTDEFGTVTHLIPSGVDVSDRKAAEMEIQQRIAQLDLALDSGQMGIWEWDIISDRVTWSPRLFDMFGHTPDNFIPTKAGFLGSIYSEDRSKMEQLIESVYARDCEAYECEFRVVRGDSGQVVWTHCRGTIRRAENGSPLSIISVAVDITDRKERELSLAFLANLQSRLTAVTKAESLMAETGQQVSEFMQLSHFLVVEMDESAERANVIHDHCKDDAFNLVGSYNMSDFATDDECKRLVTGLPMIVDDTSATMRDGKQSNNFASLGVAAILNVPSSRDTQLQFMISATKDRPHSWRAEEVSLLRQIANILRLKLERARAERALQDSEERFRDLADNISQLTWMADASGALFWYNQRWFDFTGTTFDEMKHWGWKSVQHPDYVDRVVSSWKNSLESGEVWEDTFPLRSKTGEYRWFLSRAQPIRDDQGKIQRWFGTNTDITERKFFEEQLQLARELAESANKSKSEFLANMSHEIRTPMTAILGYADLISERLQDAEALQHLSIVRHNGDFLLEIINDILDLSKIEAGKFEISQETFSPQRLVEDVRSCMEVRAATNRITLQVEYRGLVPEEIQSDSKRLRQILINLVGNAIKFTHVGSVRVVVSYSADANEMQFDVIDTGIGISDVQQERLFQPFSQGDGNVNREFGGTGLGLAISKRLTEMLGGRISLESQLGHGSRFTVSIAAGRVTTLSTVSPNVFSEAISTIEKVEIHLNCHVLVVDDRRDIRFLSKRFLTSAGATVDEAEDGEAAVAMIRDAMNHGKIYDLILLDMQMPRLDGYETARALRQLGYSQPIVALTADAMHGNMNRCLQSGCNDYLSKPIDKGNLLKMVKRLTS